MAAEERQAAQADEIDRLLRDAIALVVGEEDGKNTAQQPEAADEKNPDAASQPSVSSHRDELVGILEQVRVLARARTTEVQQLQRWLGQIQLQEQHKLAQQQLYHGGGGGKHKQGRDKMDIVGDLAAEHAAYAAMNEDSSVSTAADANNDGSAITVDTLSEDSASRPVTPAGAIVGSSPGKKGAYVGMGSESAGGVPAGQGAGPPRRATVMSDGPVSPPPVHKGRDRGVTKSKNPFKATMRTFGGSTKSHRQKLAAGASSVPFQDQLPVIKAGYLLKRKKREGKPSSWKRRWILLNGNYMYYFGVEGDTQPLGFFDCLTTTVKPAGREKSKGKESAVFDVMAVGRTYRFMHPTADGETMAWFTTIFETCQARVLDALGQNPDGSSKDAAPGAGAVATPPSRAGASNKNFDRRTISYKALLDQLRQRPDNAICAECSAPEPDWASLNLGVFVCIDCSGVHRSLGVHISKVRSCTLDAWSVEEADRMGNAEANRIWEYFIPPEFSKPNVTSGVVSRIERETYIRLKYAEKKFTKENNPQASKEDDSDDSAMVPKTQAPAPPAGAAADEDSDANSSPEADAAWGEEQSLLLREIDSLIELIRCKLEDPVANFSVPADGMKIGLFVKNIRREAAQLRVPRGEGVDMGKILAECGVERGELPQNGLTRLKQTLLTVLDEMYRRLTGSKEMVRSAACARDVEVVSAAARQIRGQLDTFAHP